MKQKTVNMTVGNPVKLLVVFSIPMLIGNIFQQFYSLVDSIIVGRYVGAQALAAIGVTGSVSFMFFSLSTGISSGGGIITSQFFGAGKTDKVKNAMVNAAYINLTLAICVSFLAYTFSGAVLRFLGTPADIYDNAMIYMHMQCLGVPFVAVYNYSASMLRALGDSRRPLYFLMLSSVLNVCLDLILVRGLNLSVFGAALATIIAQTVAGTSCLIYAIKTNPYFHMEKKDMRLDLQMVWKSVSLGVPLALQFSMIAISCMGMQRVVNSFGAVAVAAFTATNRIEQLVHQPYNSWSNALSTYCGQNKGANRYDRILKGFRRSMMVMAGFSLLMLPVMQIFGKNIIRIFVDDPEVIRLGARGLTITSWFYLALGTIIMCRGILNGIGDAAFALINGIVEMIGRIILPAIITLIPFIGIWGIWLSAGVIWGISGFFCIMRYFSWKRKMNKKGVFEPQEDVEVVVI